MKNRYTLEDGPRAISVGGKTFSYRKLIARPDELLYWKSRRRVILKVNATSKNSRKVSELDRTTAEFTALAVARKYWRIRLGAAELNVYLAFPGPTQVAVDVDLQSVRAMVDEYLSSAGADLPPAVPASALAYCMLMRKPDLWSVQALGAHQLEKILAYDQESVNRPNTADHHYRPAVNPKRP